MTTPSTSLDRPFAAGARPRGALSLRRSVSWTLVGRAFYALCQWAMLFALARLGGPEAVGRFSIALAVAGPIILFSNLGLRHVQATDTGGAYVYGDYVAVRVTTTLLALAAIVGVALLRGYPHETALVLVLVGLSKSFESMSDVVYGLEQVAHRLDLTARSLIVRGLGGVIGLSLGYWLSGQLAGGVAAMSAAWAAAYLLYDIPHQRRLLAERRAAAPGEPAPEPALRRRLRLSRISLPMGVVALLISLNINIPRYFIRSYSGEAALGVFAVMAYFVVVGTIVVNGLGQAALAVLAEHHAAGRKQAFDRLLGRMLAISVALGAAGVLVSGLFGRQLLALIYGEAFAAGSELFVWVMLAGGISYAASTLFYGVTARRIFRGQALLYAAVAATNAAAAWLLIGPFGVLGAVWAWIAALAVQVGLSAWLLARGTGDARAPASRGGE